MLPRNLVPVVIMHGLLTRFGIYTLGFKRGFSYEAQERSRDDQGSSPYPMSTLPRRCLPACW
jgi:hypothetical protein